MTPADTGAADDTCDAAEHAYERALEHFANVSSDIFALVDRDGRVLRANLAFRRLTGPASGAHDASIVALAEAEQRQAVSDALAAMSPGAARQELRFGLRIGSQTIIIEAILTYLEQDGLIAVCGRDVTREHGLERERHETEASRAALEEMGSIGHWRVGRDLKLQCSSGGARILGLDPAAPPLLLSELVSLVHAEDRQSAVTAVRTATDARKPITTLARFRRPDGDMRVLRVSGTCSVSPRNELEGMHGVFVDETSSYAALQAALSADTTVRRFMESAPFPTAMYDRDMRVLMASRPWMEDAGLAEEQVLGRNVYEIKPWLAQDFRPIHMRSLRGEVTKGNRTSYVDRFGRQCWMRWSCGPWRDQSGEIGGVIVVTDDITDVVLAREEIEASQNRMTFGMSMSDMMMWELDFERRQLHLEGEWRRFFPQKPSFESFSAGVNDWIHPADRDHVRGKWKTHLQNAAPYTVEYRTLHDSGREVWQSASIRTERTDKGTLTRAFAVVQDISARKMAEGKARDAEQRALIAGAAKTDFLANMSHELRTPLNGVLAVSEVLERTNLDGAQREMVQLIASSGRTLLRIMDDLVEFTRLEGDQIEFEIRPFDLEATLKETCETARARAEAKGLRFEVFISAAVDGVFRGDGVRIGQVLGNLLNNAVKFTDVGRVSVSVELEESDDGVGLLMMSVTDTGVGFDPGLADRLFERFEQADSSTSRRYGGLGLGLSIVKRLVEKMKGRVSARSTPGQGSVFEVEIPISRDRIAALGKISPVAIEDFEAETEIGGLKLLVAEDNPMNRRVVELLLANSDMAITFAENGREAVDRFKAGRFDIVLMDLQMPILGGLGAMREIRAWELAAGRPRTPMLAVSANATDEHVSEAKEAGADDHVAKPIVREVLFEAIARYASRGRQGAAKASDDDTFDLDAEVLAI